MQDELWASVELFVFTLDNLTSYSFIGSPHSVIKPIKFKLHCSNAHSNIRKYAQKHLHHNNGSSNHQIPPLIIVLKRAYCDISHPILHPDPLICCKAMIGYQIKHCRINILRYENSNHPVNVIIADILGISSFSNEIKYFSEE